MSARPARTPAARTLGNAVRERRMAAAWTQADLAEATGVTRQTIIAIERGGYAPSVALALALAEVLATPLERLFWLEPFPGGEA